MTANTTNISRVHRRDQVPLIYLKLMPQKISSSYTKVPGTIMHISKVPSASETDATKNKELVHKSTRYNKGRTSKLKYLGCEV